jgi:hypothetical protein
MKELKIYQYFGGIAITMQVSRKIRKNKREEVSPARIERATYSLEGCCSIR